jgi:hypothetical protein
MKISSNSSLYESLEDTSNEIPEDSVKKYSRLVLQSCVDTCTLFSLSSLNSRHQEKLDKDWEAIKQKVIDSRGMDYFTVPIPKRPKNFNEAVPLHTSAYNSIITNYFHAKTEDKYCNVIQEFIQIELNRREIDRDSLHNIWKLIQTQIESAREEANFQNYISGTCKFYERLFMEKIVESTNEDGLEKKVLEFAINTAKSLKGYKPEYDKNGLPVWCLLFLLMRSGMLDFFKNFLSSCDSARKYMKVFLHYLEYGEISESLLRDVMVELKNEEIDPFLKALLCIVSRNNETVEEVQDSCLEDYLWFKLKLVTNEDLESIEHLECEYQYSALQLTDIQRYILDCGPSHFNNSVSLYTTALVATLSYGEAVSHLSLFPEYSAEGLHLAIVLKENKLLPTFSNHDKSFNEVEGILHVNLNLMISQYIKPFASIMPNEALMYISFMTSGKSIVNETSNLVMSYENYQIVLNKEIYIFQTSFRRAIGENNFKLAIETIAEHALSQKSPEACYLFDLISSEKSVVHTWIIEIKNEIKKQCDRWKNEIKTQYSLRDEKGKCDFFNYPGQNYTKLYDKYKRENIFARIPDLESALNVLNGFLTFFIAVNLKQFRHALSVISALQVFPLKPAGRMSEYHNKYKKMVSEAKEEFPKVILTCLEIFRILMERAQGSERNEFKGDMKSLNDFFGELMANSKGIQGVEDRFAASEGLVREIFSSIIMN